jgi:serine protease
MFIMRLCTRGRAALLLLVAACGSAALAQQPGTPFAVIPTREHVQQLVQAWNGRTDYVAGEVIVRFRDGVPAPGRARALSALRSGAAPSEMRTIGDAVLIRTPSEPDARAAAAVLARQPEVAWAQPNYVRRLTSTPNDPSYSRQWNFEMLGLPRAWDINDGGAGEIRVAVVDTGVTTVNNTFSFRLWNGRDFETVAMPFRVNPDISAARILPGRDFVLWNGPVLDLNGHGTHVAGTVLQETNNNVGVAGIAYRTTLLPLKACLAYWDIRILFGALGIREDLDPEIDGVCDDAAVAQAIRFAADNGAQIINVSLGGPTPAPVQLDALRYAAQHGAFIALSAGNAFEDGNPVEYPGAYAAQVDGAVAVGAVGRSRRRAFYSSTGPHVELVAPGGDARDGGAAGAIYQVTMLPSDFTPGGVARPRFDRYVELPNQGTSMASPHVAGVAALLLSQGITRPAAIEAAMKQSATDLGTSGKDNEYGFGLVNPRAALRGQGLAR